MSSSNPYAPLDIRRYAIMDGIDKACLTITSQLEELWEGKPQIEVGLGLAFFLSKHDMIRKDRTGRVEEDDLEVLYNHIAISTVKNTEGESQEAYLTVDINGLEQEDPKACARFLAGAKKLPYENVLSLKMEKPLVPAWRRKFLGLGF